MVRLRHNSSSCLLSGDDAPTGGFMLRSVMAVIVAPIVWGLVMFPGNLLLAALFPGADASPTTDYLLAALLGTVVYSLVAGAATARVAGTRPLAHGVCGGLALLGVGVFVELQYWDVLPLWYHLSFLLLLIPACVAGAWWQARRQRSTLD